MVLFDLFGLRVTICVIAFAALRHCFCRCVVLLVVSPRAPSLTIVRRAHCTAQDGTSATNFTGAATKTGDDAGAALFAVVVFVLISFRVVVFFFKKKGIKIRI